MKGMPIVSNVEEGTPEKLPLWIQRSPYRNFLEQKYRKDPDFAEKCRVKGLDTPNKTWLIVEAMNNYEE